MFVRLLYQAYSVGRLIRSGIKHRNAGFTHVQVDQKVLPFSFFNYIVYNPSLRAATDLETILKYEKEHCKQKTQFRCNCSLAFFNLSVVQSFCMVVSKKVAQNIEYAADEATLREVTPKKNTNTDS